MPIFRSETRPALRAIHRGEEPGEIYFIEDDGTVLIGHAHDVHADEQWRTREAILELLARAGVAVAR